MLTVQKRRSLASLVPAACLVAVLILLNTQGIEICLSLVQGKAHLITVCASPAPNATETTETQNDHGGPKAPQGENGPDGAATPESPNDHNRPANPGEHDIKTPDRPRIQPTGPQPCPPSGC